MMTTMIVLVVEHKKPIPDLADMVAGRAYTIDGVRNTELAFVAPAPNREELARRAPQVLHA